MQQMTLWHEETQEQANHTVTQTWTYEDDTAGATRTYESDSLVPQDQANHMAEAAHTEAPVAGAPSFALVRVEPGRKEASPEQHMCALAALGLSSAQWMEPMMDKATAEACVAYFQRSQATIAQLKQHIREHAVCINQHEHLLSQLVVAFYQREGWRALGHASFADGVQQEFTISTAQGYRLYHFVLFIQAVGATNPPIKQRHYRTLAVLKDLPTQIQAYRYAQQLAQGKPIKQQHLWAAVCALDAPSALSGTLSEVLQDVLAQMGAALQRQEYQTMLLLNDQIETLLTGALRAKAC